MLFGPSPFAHRFTGDVVEIPALSSAVTLLMGSRASLQNRVFARSRCDGQAGLAHRFTTQRAGGAGNIRQLVTEPMFVIPDNDICLGHISGSEAFVAVGVAQDSARLTQPATFQVHRSQIHGPKVSKFLTNLRLRSSSRV